MPFHFFGQNYHCAWLLHHLLSRWKLHPFKHWHALPAVTPTISSLTPPLAIVSSHSSFNDYLIPTYPLLAKMVHILRRQNMKTKRLAFLHSIFLIYKLATWKRKLLLDKGQQKQFSLIGKKRVSAWIFKPSSILCCFSSFLPSKSQIISIGIFGILGFFQKTNEQIRFFA